MKRIIQDPNDVRRYDRWGFEDPAPRIAPEAREPSIAPEAPEPPIAPQARKEPIPPQRREEPMSWPKRAEPVVQPTREERAPPRPLSNPAASPWRKIQIPDEERQRAALAGLHRYVGRHAPDETGARKAPLPVAARFAAPREEAQPVAPFVPPPTQQASAVPPEPADEPTEADDKIRAAEMRARYARRPEMARAMPPPAAAQGNPHLGLTVGVIVGLSLMAAVGLSWVAAPAIDAAPPQRADLLQSFSPQMVEPSPGLTRPTTPDRLIEVAPSMPARPAVAAAVQPIEVAP